jgi:hypothetical protein
VEAPLDVSVPETAAAAQALGWHELQVVAARLIGELPDNAEHAGAMPNVVPAVIDNGGGDT